MIKMLIIDYGMCNLNSVRKKFTKIGIQSTISTDPDKIIAAEKLVLPGIGHFKVAVENLKKSGLWDALNHAVTIKHVPILGICLGMQLMAKHSEEGGVYGLGWFDAQVVRFKVNDRIKYKIPHMGWNTAKIMKHSSLLNGVSENQEFYFVHSYHYQCQEASEVLTYTDYEYEFCSAVERDNIFGVQFHPEKSHEHGEQILKNFAAL